MTSSLLQDEIVRDRVDVSTWPVRRVEQAGSTPTTWLSEPGTDTRWLHKNTHIPSNGIEQGEDWSEIIASHVADVLGVPCATTRLCVRHGRRGSLSRSVLPPAHDLWEGHLVLQEAQLPDYYPHLDDQPARDPARPRVKRPGHTLVNIRTALAGIAAPAMFSGPGTMTGFGVFAGYTVLDALIANSDRHEQNWAIIAPPLLSTTQRLSPSYDHASSLGYNLTDAKREATLTSGRLEAWAERGEAVRFEHVGRPVTLVEHAVSALDLCDKDEAAWWRQRVLEVDLAPVLDSLAGQPALAMSDLATTFTKELLRLNLRRLRDAIRISA